MAISLRTLKSSQTSNVLEASSITSTQLSNQSVTTAKVVDENITTAKIAANAVTVEKITDNAVTDTKLSTNLAANIAAGSSPKITTISYPNEDLAVSPDGGDTVILTGSGFKSGAQVYINGSAAPSITVTNSTSISFTTPALSTGSYLIYVINTDGSTGIAVPGLQVSGTPTWTTSAGSLTNATEAAYTDTINAVSDSTITYSIYSGALPEGLTLNANTGVISGTLAGNVANLSSNTTYNFSVDASDAELQNTIRSFSILYVPTFPTWYSPEAGALTNGEVDVAYTVTLNAISNSNVTYTIPSGNLIANVDISGNVLTGTSPEANTYYFTIRATDEEGHYTDREFSLNINVPGDTYFNYNVLLLQGDGTNGAQNNTFVDSSSNNFTITRNGDATQGTFSPFSQEEGKWSAHFPNNADNSRVQTPYNSAFDFGTGAFTLEFWTYPTETPFYGQVYSAEAGGAFQVSQYGTRIDVGRDSVASAISTPEGVLNLNEWNHVAVVRDSSSRMAIFINGVREAYEASVTVDFNLQGQPLRLGSARTYSPYTYGVVGYLSNLLADKGSSKYDPTQSSITVPTEPLSAGVNTSILTFQSNRFVDNSGNNFTLTPNGNISVQPFSPFNPSAAYSAATNGGSVYFDGTGDYLTIAANSAFYLPGDFTVEFWLYCNDYQVSSDGPDLFHTGNNGSEQFNIMLSSGKVRVFANDSGAYDTVGSIVLGKHQWNHIAVTRSGTSQRIFVNGVLDRTDTTSYNYTGSGGVMIGWWSAHSATPPMNLNGFISSLRVVKGTALYTTSFTPPTTPLTTVSGTSLLCNFTNGGVVDATGRNILQTVDNAQISTSVKKYGTGSMYFDGTSDYLSSPASKNYAFFTGDFTIEMWAYPTSLPNGGWGFVSHGPAATSGYWMLELTADAFYWQASGVANIISVSSSGFTLNNWHHIAISRSNGTVKLFLNGTAIGSASDTNNYSGYSSGSLTIGKSYNNAYAAGYIDDLRITKGLARYTANFTPPTEALLNR